MSANMVAVLYLLSALLFIFALRGLSHPESSRLGNIFGIVGMVIAIITTLMFKSVLSYSEIGAAILAAGPIGHDISKIFGIIGVVLASINIFGGFIVTYRMLSMFKKKPKKEKKD